MSTNPADDNAKYASKTRVARIPLTYYRRADPIDRMKMVLTGLAIVGFGAWAAFGLVAAPEQHSPGQVASVHAMWNTQCAACHQPFEPTTAASFNLFGGATRHGSVQCQQCHTGGAHHTNLKTEEQGCASCHHEHRGLDANLSLVADANCTSCHRDVDAHAKDNVRIARTPPFAADAIRSFVDGHPEFKSLRGPDPGKLKFSHSRHMTLGQQLVPGGREAKKKVTDLPPQYQASYAKLGVGPEQVIQLDCASCHDSGSPSGGPPTSGDYMQPVNFERHCAACHQQTFAPVAPRANAAVANVALENAALELETMPHGLGPKEMERIAKAAIVERFLAKQDKNPAPQPADELGFPGKSSKPDTVETAAWITEHLPRAELMLRDRCVQCHSFPAGAAESPLQSALVKTEVPAVWLKKGMFDHRAHRAVSCVACHEQAAASWKPNTPILDDEQVMIAGYESCVKCHAPTTAVGTVGARFDCVACHRYHGADKPPGFFDRSFKPLEAHDERSLLRMLESK